MGRPTPAMIELAHKLFAFEERSDLDSNGEKDSTRVIEKLRILLTRFSGSDSYAALMRRAVVLARMEDPSLEGRAVTQSGSIPSFEGISIETSLTLTAHLLDLMGTFIGHALTVTLLAETWPADKLKDG